MGSPDELKNENLPAAFWDALPENGDDNPDMAAINALLEESSPEERAENFKVHANDLYTKAVKLKTNNKFYVRKAVEAYSKGISLHCADKKLVSVLHSNRAQAHLRLGNYRAALEDAVTSFKEDANNAKAYYRGALAAVRLADFEKALELCRAGLLVEPDAPELCKMQKDAETKLAAEKARTNEEAALKVAQRAPARKLAAALLARSWKLGLPQFNIGTRKPFLEEDGSVHTPVLLIFPETMQMDIIEDFAAHETLSAHLDVMFSDDAEPLTWDSEHAYTRERIRIFYLTHAATPLSQTELVEVLMGGWPENRAEDGPSKYGPKSATWKEVPEASTLDEVLQEDDYVVPGIPVFFLVAEGTDFKERLLSGEHRVF